MPRVFVHMYRFAEKHPERDGISEEGTRAAIEEGHRLAEVIPESSEVHFLTSDAGRCRETAQAISGGLRRGVSSFGSTAQLGPPRIVNNAIYGIAKGAYGPEGLIEKWLVGERETGLEHPERVAERVFKATIERAKQEADKPGKKPIHFVVVTHSGALDRIAEKLIGSSFKELGGLSGPLERLDFAIPREGKLIGFYRNENFEHPRGVKFQWREPEEEPEEERETELIEEPEYREKPEKPKRRRKTQ